MPIAITSVGPISDWTDVAEVFFENQYFTSPPLRRPHDGLDRLSQHHLWKQALTGLQKLGSFLVAPTARRVATS